MLNHSENNGMEEIGLVTNPHPSAALLWLASMIEYLSVDASLILIVCGSPISWPAGHRLDPAQLLNIDLGPDSI